MGEPTAPATPTWVKALITAGIVLAVALTIVLLTTSGHGPARHAP